MDRRGGPGAARRRPPCRRRHRRPPASEPSNADRRNPRALDVAPCLSSLRRLGRGVHWTVFRGRCYARGGLMSIPLRQSARIASYLLKQKVKRNDKYPLLVELEPLFQCNLACSFCGKIQYPQHILKQRMPVDKALAAIEECGAPMVSIAGGEPLVHPEVHVIAKELIRRKKFVFLCTNGILMKKKMDDFEPSPYFAW